MHKHIFVLSFLLFISLSGFGQVFKIVLNQPAVLDIDSGSDTLICESHSVVLGGFPTATGGTKDYIYMWSPIKDLDDPTSPNPTATPSESTKYILTVTDSNGCQLMDFINVTVDACLGINQELIKNDLSVYPNPSTGIFTLSGIPANGKQIKISLINSMGREVMTRLVPSGSESEYFDLAGLGISKGVYFLRIMTDEKVVIHRIQIIQEG